MEGTLRLLMKYLLKNIKIMLMVTETFFLLSTFKKAKKFEVFAKNAMGILH